MTNGDPIIARDDDLLIGRKRILHFLQLSDWEAVVARIQKEGLPVEKVCGRIEMSLQKYRTWRAKFEPGKGIIDRGNSGAKQ